MANSYIEAHGITEQEHDEVQAEFYGADDTDGSDTDAPYNYDGPEGEAPYDGGGWPGDGSGTDDLADYNAMEANDYGDE